MLSFEVSNPGTHTPWAIEYRSPFFYPCSLICKDIYSRQILGGLMKRIGLVDGGFSPLHEGDDGGQLIFGKRLVHTGRFFIFP